MQDLAAENRKAVHQFVSEIAQENAAAKASWERIIEERITAAVKSIQDAQPQASAAGREVLLQSTAGVRQHMKKYCESQLAALLNGGCSTEAWAIAKAECESITVPILTERTGYVGATVSLAEMTRLRVITDASIARAALHAILESITNSDKLALQEHFEECDLRLSITQVMLKTISGESDRDLREKITLDFLADRAQSFANFKARNSAGNQKTEIRLATLCVKCALQKMQPLFASLFHTEGSSGCTSCWTLSRQA